MEQLLEKRSIAEIKAFFAARDIELVVHENPPAPPTSDELSRMPRVVRRSREKDTSTHWVDLGTMWPHFGRGAGEEDAIRAAAKRYRVEQADPDARSS